MDQQSTTGIVILCGVVCIWPAIVSVLAIIAYRRYREGGWKAIINPRGKISND